MNKEGSHRAELYVRSLLPDSYSQRQAEVVQRLGRLVGSGVLTERQVHPCGNQLPATPAEANTDVGEWLVERFLGFNEWASTNGCGLDPAFEIREVNDTMSGAQYRALRPPAILLAEYREGELVCVTPHRDGETVRTVLDRIAELEAGTTTTYEPVADTKTDRTDARVIQQ